MNFAVESWEPGYGTSVGDGAREGINDPSTRPVDPSVEIAPQDWRSIEPTVAVDERSLPTVVFVDGVRRIDARIWIEELAIDGEPPAMSRPGVCASVAAGAVRCTPGRAEIDQVLVRRGLYTASDNGQPVHLSRSSASGLGTYELRPVADDSDEAMYFGVHQHMTELEYELSETVAGDGLVIYDGPLAERANSTQQPSQQSSGDDTPTAVGYIKTQHVQYLSPDLHAVIGGLDVGQRTPLFSVGGRFPVWSWYLRLPAPVAHAMSGVVRLELSTAGRSGAELKQWAISRADMVSRLLPRFASEPHKDGRAPQNLYPIAGLERHLRHLLGDYRVLERALRNITAAGRSTTIPSPSTLATNRVGLS